MSSARLNDQTARPRPTSVPFSAIPQLPWRQRPGTTSRRSNYSDDRSQTLHFRPRGLDSPVDFDPIASQSNGSSLSVSTTTSYTHAALPPTASADLVAATISLTDLQHMEVIYDADRKREFQALVRRYMNQLLHGCDREGVCTVPTCWTARKRLVGNGGAAGVGQGRKLTVLSARIMACTLACRDNPYEGLCDGKPVEVGLAVKDTKRVDVGQGKLQTLSPSPARSVGGGEPKSGGKGDRTGNVGVEEKEDSAVMVKQKRVDAAGESRDNDEPKFQKRSVDSGAKDTKSFTQMLFDTRPLRMLEWLSIPPPITSFRFNSTQTLQDKAKDAPTEDESRSPRDCVGPLGGGISSANGELAEEATTEIPTLPKCLLGESSNTHMFPPLPDTPIKSPTPPSPAANKRRETLHEIVTPTPHSNQRRAAASQNPPQTPIAPPQIHLPQRQHRRERPVYEYHQSQFTEHFYGIPPPQQTPSRASSKQLDYDNPFGCLTPTDSSPANTPGMDGSLDTQLTIPPPQTLSYLDIGLILSLVKLCIEGEMPLARHTEADTFARQSVFYCLSNPDVLMRSFGMGKGKSRDSTDAYDMDPLTTDKAFRLMAWKWENTVLKSLWKGLEEIYKYKATSPRQKKAANGGSTPMPNKRLKEDAPTGPRQHLLDDYAATYMIIMSIHALAAMLPRRGSYLPREHAREEEWLAMRMVRGRGLVTVDIGDCFENELAERLMKRVVRALNYRIAQAAQGLRKGEENPVERLLILYLRKCVIVEMEALKGEELPEDTFGAKEASAIKNWSVVGCMLEWARTVLLKDWDGNEQVKKGSVTAGATTLIKLLCKSTVPRLAHHYKLYTGLTFIAPDDNHRLLHLEPEIFITPLIADRLDPKEAPVVWYQSLKDSRNDRASGAPEAPIHLISHPFLFTPSTLVTYFRAINLSIMTSYYESALSTLSLMRQVCLNQYFPATKEQRDKFVEDKLKIACTTYLLMGIRREHILEDAFNGVYKREIRELMKPLKIKFLDSFEEGVDQGGPQIEFFDVLTKEVMGQGYGMFVDTDNVNHISWFTVKPLEELHKFELLGVLMGIAIYNGITLPVSFPLIFYKKLLGGEAEGLEDIEDAWPELVKGLRQMLEWEEGDVEDVFCRTYEFAYETVGGGRGSIDMMRAKKMGWRTLEAAQNGLAQIDTNTCKEKQKASNSEDDWLPEPDMVTNANRHEYVADYIAWLTNFSIFPQFTAFRRGVLSILPTLPLTLLFTPLTLKSLFEGSPTIDIHALESITKYDDGYHANHPLIREFWSVVHDYPEVQKRALLEFVTASDRLPGGGVGEPGGQGAITFVIQRVGQSENLPTSMTCFGRLLLPEYEVGKGKVKEKLGRALENSRGFGII